MGHITDFDLAADKLLGYVVLNLVNRNRGVTLDLPGHPVHEAGVQPFLGFRAAELRVGVFVALIRFPIDSFVKTVVVLVDILAIDFVELLQAVDLGRICTKEKLFLDTPPVALLLAFVM